MSDTAIKDAMTYEGFASNNTLVGILMLNKKIKEPRMMSEFSCEARFYLVMMTK